MPNRAAPLLALLLTACVNPDQAFQGPLQPQTIDGACQVKHFFLLAQTTVHTTLTPAPDSSACAFTLINPDLQAFPTAALLTTPPAQGRATTALVNGGRSVRITYTPQPGDRRPDRFIVTIEPNDHAVAFAVTP